MKNLTLTAILTICFFTFFSQDSYVSYMTGDEADVQTDPMPGILLAGGASDNDEAMKWFLERANGGDVVVIRASGSDGYNDYLFSELGVPVNSVETILFVNGSASEDPYVLSQLSNAEAIWIAGGNQWDYVDFWKDTEVEDIINNLMNEIGGPVGGTSAGMAILGGSYFNAMNGTVYSDESLENPYNNWLHLGHGDFLEAPFLSNVVTDTHYDDPDRRGRHVAFMARMFADEGLYPLGIACDEYTAVGIDENGIGWCFGEYPDYDDYIYFVRPNCINPYGPETCVENENLHWYREGEALKVYRVSATLDGDRYFDLNTWDEGTGGQWQTWYVENGVLNFEEDTSAPDCPVAVGISETIPAEFDVYPQPALDFLNVESNRAFQAQVYAADGRRVAEWRLIPGTNRLDVSILSPGLYSVVTEKGGFQFLKQ